MTLADSPATLHNFLSTAELLNHRVVCLPFSTTVHEINSRCPQAVILDGLSSLIVARNTAQILDGAGLQAPILLVLAENGLAAISSSWQIHDIVLDTASPAEIEARLKLLVATHCAPEPALEAVIEVAGVLIDENAYTARLKGQPLNLTYKEFELLKFLAQHSGRVFTRAQLLTEVWGYDYYGGTRTVDVHIRRLRSKLGTEHEHLISTIRNVGYSFGEVRS